MPAAIAVAFFAILLIIVIAIMFSWLIRLQHGHEEQEKKLQTVVKTFEELLVDNADPATVRAAVRMLFNDNVRNRRT